MLLTGFMADTGFQVDFNHRMLPANDYHNAETYTHMLVFIREWKSI